MSAGTAISPSAATAGLGATASSAHAATEGKLAEFQSFLKGAGHLAGVVLSEIVHFAIPLASLVSLADPELAPASEAFAASLKLVQTTVIAVQQRWAAEGSAANAQKLADVLEIVEQPIVTMFAQAGTSVDTTYVTNLVNGVVALLNALPAQPIKAVS